MLSLQFEIALRINHNLSLFIYFLFLVNVHKFPMVSHVENIEKNSIADEMGIYLREIHGGKTDLDIFTWVLRGLTGEILFMD